jgi:Tol biopolymer transport system component
VRDLQNLTNRALTTGGVVASAATASGKSAAFAGVIPGVPATNLYVWDSSTNAIVFTNTTAGITNIAISSDGKRVAFVTSAALWIADRSAQTNWQVASNPRSGPKFNADGNRMVYARFVSSWVQTYLYDINARSEQLISHALNFVDAAGGNSDLPDISPDGRFVVYRSTATNIVSGVNSFIRQLILYDRVTGQNSLVSASRFAGSPADDFSMRASFSADGQTLLFQSWASDLTPGDFNRSGDVFAQAIFTAVILPSQAGQGRLLYWPFIPGNNYSVEFKNSLNDPLWQPLAGVFTNIGVKAWIQDSSPANDLRFYRIRAF